MAQYLHFTIGPVQRFVAQARRTRDYWSGSFLLSWLAGVAAAEVVHQGGSIKFPSIEKEWMDWLQGRGQGDPPAQGGIPNRFLAELPADVDGKPIANSVQEAWRSLADHVWAQDLEPIANDTTHAIWTRQVENFWEISWALSEGAGESHLLDRRKNLRSHLSPFEPGRKCMLMDGYQELSGSTIAGQGEAASFWKTVANSLGSHDLRAGEHLCAMAFIKRRLAAHFPSFKTTLESGLQIEGWDLPRAVPSVMYLAAAPWLARVFSKPEAIEGAFSSFFAKASKQDDVGQGEWSNEVACLRRCSGVDKKWRTLDAHVYFDQGGALYRGVKEIAEVAKVGVPSPFYAVLSMDGDSLGQQMSDTERQPHITDGLREFTQKVPEIIDQHSGFLVYAGGDDVLALLPLEQALDCALAVRNHYRQCFSKRPVSTTLSGAVLYAHVRTPLGAVLHGAHSLLDKVAKETTGRDALAVEVWKPGQVNLRWSQPWDVALNGQDRLVINDLVDQVVADGEDALEVSGGFFYKIREQLELLNPKRDMLVSGGASVETALSDEQAIRLMVMEFMHSDLNPKLKGAERYRAAETFVRPLMGQCVPRRRIVNGADIDIQEQRHALSADAALLVRFLASKGVER